MLYVRPIRFLILFAVCVLATAALAKQQTKPPISSSAKVAVAASNPTFQKAIGNPNAPITMEVFGDFQCPACRGFFEGTTKQVIDDYVIPGKVYLIHRDFPLDMHPYARQAARLANAAINLINYDAQPASDIALFNYAAQKALSLDLAYAIARGALEDCRL